VTGLEEVASVAEGTIRRWIREGKLVGHKAGRVVRVKRADLEALLRAGGRRDEASPEELARRAFGG
jgi:excisionase family DNA binding protein